MCFHAWGHGWLWILTTCWKPHVDNCTFVCRILNAYQNQFRGTLNDCKIVAMAQGLWFLPHGPLDRLAWRENGYVSSKTRLLAWFPCCNNWIQGGYVCMVFNIFPMITSGDFTNSNLRKIHERNHLTSCIWYNTQPPSPTAFARSVSQGISASMALWPWRSWSANHLCAHALTSIY